MRFLCSLLLLSALTGFGPVSQAQNLNDVPTDLNLPAMAEGAPAAGKRVRATTQGWGHTQVHHTLYLPTDWQAGAKTQLPVLVEYAGNGGYKNKLGDVSDGTVEGCLMGYGLSAGRGFIWVCVPFIENGANAIKWWGDVAETKRYCLASVKDVCARYGGDEKRVVLMGFSRGAIACNYIGLHDDEIAKLWCGMICHSHYEGEFKHPASDQADWPERLKRLGSRPQWISQELGTEKTRVAIASTGLDTGTKGQFTCVTLPYANHSVRWLYCDLPIRTQAREWLRKLVE